MQSPCFLQQQILQKAQVYLKKNPSVSVKKIRIRLDFFSDNPIINKTDKVPEK